MYSRAIAVAAGALLLAGAGCVPDDGPASDPAWSPDGKRIAFTANVRGSLDVYVAARGGGAPKRLTKSRANDGLPAWSPDGRRIAFVSDRNRDFEIYVMNADGSHQRRLTRSRGVDTSPAWSPDGTQIAFATSRDAGGARDDSERIYVMAADGSAPRPVTPAERHTYHTTPAWSPDGSEIAFTVLQEPELDELESKEDEEDLAPVARIDVIGVDGSGRRSVTSEGIEPDWSPDGRSIAFTSVSDEPELRVLALDGGAERPLSASGTLASSPAWSPDGKEIAFTRYLRRAGAQIYRMKADGRSSVAVTHLVMPRAATGERCTVVGTARGETLVGTSRSDVICGLGGDDVLRGRGGRDVLDGGPGNDRLDAGAGDDILVGRGGSDALDGGAGKDVLDSGAGRDALLARDGFVDRVDGGVGPDHGTADRDDWVRSVESLAR